MPTMGSKNADFLVVFCKKRNKKLPVGVGAQGAMTWAKNPKPTLIMTSSTKKRKFETSQFLNSKLEDFPYL